MKLGSLKSGGRDGTLVVVSRDLKRAARVPEYRTLQAAIEEWDRAEPVLRKAWDALEGGKAGDVIDVKPQDMASVLPRAYQFLDGSAYLPHVERVRKARGAEMPPSFKEDPLMYQAVSDGFTPPMDPILAGSEDYGIDFESEVGIVTDDVPMGISADEAAGHVKLILILNDVSLRKLIPNELKKGFGFVHGKPRSALSPVAVTPDELGDAWKEDKVQLPLVTHLNGDLFGNPECGVDMQFSFAELVAHAAKTRPLSAGTVIGSGTIANRDESRGSSCLAEKRVLEVIKDGEATTPFMSFGDRVHIEMFDADGNSIFGPIDQVVEKG